MKTQILRLEPHDDVISARDKMEWSQTGRILLVWPERGRILTRRIDLILLQRHSQSLGAQLAVIARDPLVCYNAAQLGIPVYKDLRQAQKSSWRMNRGMRWRKRIQRPPSRSNPVNLDELHQPENSDPHPWLVSPTMRYTAFAVSILALLSIAAIIIPGAEITITPHSQEQQITLDVRSDPDIDKINLSGVIPTHSLGVVLSDEMSTRAEGFSSIPDETARVDLLLTNLTDQAVVVAKGTVVRTQDDEPRRFSIINPGQVPAGVGQTVSLRARALIPGVEGNVPAGQLTTIEGALGTRLTVTNPLPASGGSNLRVMAPTISQREKLNEQLIRRLQQQALAEIGRQTRSDDLLLTPTLTITQVIREEYDPPQGQPSDRLNLAVTLDFQAQVARNEDIEALAKAVLDANVPDGFLPIPDTLVVEVITQPEVRHDRRVSWRIRAAQQIQADLEENSASSLIRGLAPGPAIERLKAALPVDGVSSVQIFPSWWPRLPILPFRITVRS